MVTKSGSFFSYGDERLGQGRNNAKGYLDEHLEVAKEIEAKIYAALNIGQDLVTPIDREPGAARRPRPPPRRRRRDAAAGRAPAGCSVPCEADVPAGERRVQDPEARLEHARALAWGALNRRERTEAELRALLARKRGRRGGRRGGPRRAARQSGYVDDARYAERFAEDRRRLDGWGAERIEQRLRALGVEPGVAAAAAAGARPPARSSRPRVALLRRRVPTVPATPRERDRALGILVRKGYGLDVAHDALRRHAGVPEPEW